MAVAGISALFSFTPLSSAFRVFVLLASGLGGFWCAQILLQTPENQRRFTWLCLWILGGLLVLSFLGYFISGYIEYFIGDRSHPLTNVILLLSFAPLALLGQKSRPLMVLGIILLALSYITLCLSERISVVFIPLGVCLAGVLFGTLRWKYFVLICLVMALVVGVFHQKILWFKFSTAYPVQASGWKTFLFPGHCPNSIPGSGSACGVPGNNSSRIINLPTPASRKRVYRISQLILSVPTTSS